MTQLSLLLLLRLVLLLLLLQQEHLLLLFATLDGALDGLLDLFEDGNAFPVGQVGEVVATAVIVLEGARGELKKSKRKTVSRFCWTLIWKMDAMW